VSGTVHRSSLPLQPPCSVGDGAAGMANLDVRDGCGEDGFEEACGSAGVRVCGGAVSGREAGRGGDSCGGSCGHRSYEMKRILFYIEF